MPSRSSLAFVAGLFTIIAVGAGTAAWMRAPSADTRAATSSSTSSGAANEITASTTPAPIGERLLDTTTAPSPPPVATARAPKKVTKPGSDENLPSWVPLRGRLTVVEAPDLAENLGLVPKGATKTAQARISVAETLALNTQTAQSGAGPRSATWLASNGRVRHGHGRGR
jgi:hypothetical protein